MSEFKGTPRPWVNVGGWVDAEKSGDLSSIICAIDSVASKNPESVNDANAQLISAAPELLEALQDMLSGWEYIRSQHGDLYGVGWDRAQNKAKSAISKALGK